MFLAPVCAADQAGSVASICREDSRSLEGGDTLQVGPRFCVSLIALERQKAGQARYGVEEDNPTGA